MPNDHFRLFVSIVITSPEEIHWSFDCSSHTPQYNMPRAPTQNRFGSRTNFRVSVPLFLSSSLGRTNWKAHVNDANRNKFYLRKMIKLVSLRPEWRTIQILILMRLSIRNNRAAAATVELFLLPKLLTAFCAATVWVCGGCRHITNEFTQYNQHINRSTVRWLAYRRRFQRYILILIACDRNEMWNLVPEEESVRIKAMIWCISRESLWFIASRMATLMFSEHFGHLVTTQLTLGGGPLVDDVRVCVCVAYSMRKRWMENWRKLNEAVCCY